MRRSRFETHVSFSPRSAFNPILRRGGIEPARPRDTTETSSMRIASWSWGGRQHVGTRVGRRPRGHAAGWWTMPVARRAAADRGARARRAAAAGQPAPRLAVDAITLRAPLPRPRRNMFCVGRNYRSHAQELAGSVFRDSLPKEHQWPIVFTKFPETRGRPARHACACRATAVSEQIDYESELAVIIGRGGRDITQGRAMDHVFGYTVVNDVSARDVQVRHQQWDARQELRHLLPDGPVDRHRRRARRPRHARARLGHAGRRRARAAPGRAARAT